MVLPILITPLEVAALPCSWMGRGRLITTARKATPNVKPRLAQKPGKTEEKEASPRSPWIKNRLATSVELQTCEAISKAVLKRWRQAQTGLWARVSRLARSCNEAGTVALAKGDSPAISWMLLAMFWRGSSHPMSLVQPAVHPYIGLLRWMLTAPSVQVSAHDASRLPVKILAILGRLLWRAKKLTQILLRRARRTGRVKLTPQLLADEYWLGRTFAEQ